MPTIAAGYFRISTAQQDTSLQVSEVREYAKRQGWELREYSEQESTSKRRPILESLMADAKAKRFSVLICYKLDRLGRSVQELVSNIEELDRAGVRFIAVTQGIDTDQRSPTGRLLLQMLAAIAEFEKSLIKERVIAGNKAYREAWERGEVGKSRHSRSGKDLPPGRPQRVVDRLAVREAVIGGMTVRKAAAQFGIGVGTAQRIAREAV